MLTPAEFDALKEIVAAYKKKPTVAQLMEVIESQFMSQNPIFSAYKRATAKESVSPTRVSKSAPVDELEKRELKSGFKVATQGRSRNADDKAGRPTAGA